MAQPNTKNPKQFPTQRLDEKPIIVIHRHWIALAKFWLEGFAIAIIPPIFIAVMYGFEILTYDPEGAIFISIVLFSAVYYLFVARHLFQHWVDYYLDIWAITDQRIVSIELAGLFNRVISELPVDKVQDVTSEIKGFLATFLDYGNVFIQTAGERERFIFEEVPYPQKIQTAILRVHDQFLNREQKQASKQVAAAVTEGQQKAAASPKTPSKK